MITVAFRLDDPSETSNQTVEAGILDAFRTLHAACTFAVIPFRIVDGKRIPLSAARARPLVDAAHAGVIEPALHGYVHARIHPEMATPSEFAGRPRDEQQRMIIEGRAHLESVFGRPVTGFVPPWNSYDSTTPGVLEEAGFKYLSASWHATANSKESIRILPLTVHLGEIPQAIDEARLYIKANPVIVVVMHHYDFMESGSDQASISLGEFSNLLSLIACQADIHLRTLAEISGLMISPDIPIRQHRLQKKHHLMARFLPKHSFLNASPWRGMLAKTFFS